MIGKDETIVLSGEVKLEAINLEDNNWGIFCEHEHGYSNILAVRSLPFVFKHSSKIFIEHVVQELNNLEDLELSIATFGKTNLPTTNALHNQAYDIDNEKVCCFFIYNDFSSYNLYSDRLILKYLFEDKELKEFKARKLWEILTTDICLFVADGIIDNPKIKDGEFAAIGNYFRETEIFEADKDIKNMHPLIYEIFEKEGIDSPFEKNQKEYENELEKWDLSFDASNPNTWENSLYPPRYSYSPEAEKLVYDCYKKNKDRPFIKEWKKLDLDEFICIYALSHLSIGSVSVLAPYYCLKHNKKSSFYANYTAIMWSVTPKKVFTTLEGGFNQILNYLSLVEDPDAKYLKELAAIGENIKIEYKTQVRYDQPYNKKDERFKYHYYEVIREICAFANREGGEILVGYHEKSKKFIGIRVTNESITNEKNGRKGKKNEDMENIDEKSFCDRWELYIREHLYHLTESSMVTNLVNFKFLKMNDLLFAVIHVEMLPIPEDFIECKHLTTGRRVIYMREGALARRLQGNEPIELSRKRNMGQLD